MKKKQVQATAVFLFGVLLAFASAIGGGVRQEELAQVQSAMRELRRVDDLRLSYHDETVLAEGTQKNDVTVWADLLSGHWFSEHYTSDEDGTRLYLKQFCDGTDVYYYIEWSGTWQRQENAATEVPYLDAVTSLSCRGSDIMDIESATEKGWQRISYAYTPEYIERQNREQKRAIEETLERQQAGEDGENPEMARYLAFRQEQLWVEYRIDADGVLRGMESEAELSVPDVIYDMDGEQQLGDARAAQMKVKIEIEKYNKDTISKKVMEYMRDAGLTE